VIQFTVHGIPAPAGSKRAFVVKGRAVVTDASAKSRPWKALVADAAAQAMNGAQLLRGPLCLSIVFHVPRPKGHIGKHGVRPSAPRFPAVRPDVDKLSRAVLDALSGVLYIDDAQIVEKTVAKYYGEPARAEITVRELAETAQQELSAA